MKLVTIVIPIYNVEKYIEECLSSVVCQTYNNLEILCIDDCGTDNSINIVERYACSDKRIKIIHHSKNMGLAPARNTGIINATGDFIFFLDSDDYLHNKTIEMLVNIANNTSSDVVISKAEAFPDIENDIIKKRTNDINVWLNRFEPAINYQVNLSNFSDAINNLPCISWGKLFASSFIRNNQLFFIKENIIHEDDGFFIKFMSCMPNISYISYIGVMYRIRPESISSIQMTKKNKQKSFKHKLLSVKDACNYIKIYNNKKYDKIIKILHNNTDYNIFIKRPFDYIFKKFCKQNIQKISLLKIPLYSKRITNDNSLKIKILGIPIKNFKFGNYLREHIIHDINVGLNFETQNNNDVLLKILNNLGIFYFIPNKGNLGDIMIAASEFQYFDAKNLTYTTCDANTPISEPFNLVYGGGGIWISNYKKDYEEILQIFKSPLLKKCVILPSSFNDCDDLLEILDERFVVFCREKKSFDYCKQKNNKAKFLFADDMVIGADFEMFNNRFHDDKNLKNFVENNFDNNISKIVTKIYPIYEKAIDTAIKEIKKCKDFRIGYLLRTDKESNINKSITNICIDPSSFAGGFGCDKGLDFILSKLFLAVINKFEIVVTDRLHIAICAAKLGKHVLMLDNSYGKLSEVYKNSLSKMPNVCLSSTDNLEKDLSNIDKICCNNPQYIEFFDTLPKTIEEFIIQYGSFKNDYGCERRFW